MVDQNQQGPKKLRRRLWALLIGLLLIGACYWFFFSPVDLNLQDDIPSRENIIIDGELTDSQRSELDSLIAQSSIPVDILVPDGEIQYISASFKVPDSIVVNAKDKAIHFLKENEDFFQLGEIPASLRYEQTKGDELGFSYVYFTQLYQGVPVFGSSIIIGIDPSSNIVSINSIYSPGLDISIQPSIRSIEAENIVLEGINQALGKASLETNLAIYPQDLDASNNNSTNILAWVVSLSMDDGLSSIFFVDAHNGRLIDQIDEWLDLTEIWDVQGEDKLDNAVKLFDEQGDSLVDYTHHNGVRAKENLKIIENFFSDSFGKTYFSDPSTNFEIYLDYETAHQCYPEKACYPKSYGDDFIILCDGWGDDLDVFAHEYTHAVTVHNIRNTWRNRLISTKHEAVSVFEGFADIFAAFIDESGDPWKISGVQNNGEVLVIRDLSNVDNNISGTTCKKNCGFFADHYEDYIDNKVSFRDKVEAYPWSIESHKCDVHEMSTIISYAAYLISEGGNNNGKDIEGIGIGKTKQLFFNTLEFNLAPNTKFPQVANSLIDTCKKYSEVLQHGITYRDCEQVTEALISVGLKKEDSNVLGINSYRNQIGDWISRLPVLGREYFDNILADLRGRIEAYLQDYYENLRQRIQDWWDDLMQKLASELEAYVYNQLTACCTSLLLPLMIPALVLSLKRRKN